MKNITFRLLLIFPEISGNFPENFWKYYISGKFKTLFTVFSDAA